MSDKYKTGDDVPAKVLAYRLEELSDCITKSDLSQFVMRVPAELDHCPDLVMSIAADRLMSLEAKLKEREWIRLSKSCPKHGRSYDIWIKSSENDKYGRRIADVIFFEGYFDTKFRQQPVTHPEYISHYSPLPSPPKEQE